MSVGIWGCKYTREVLTKTILVVKIPIHSLSCHCQKSPPIKTYFYHFNVRIVAGSTTSNYSSQNPLYGQSVRHMSESPVWPVRYLSESPVWSVRPLSENLLYGQSDPCQRISCMVSHTCQNLLYDQSDTCQNPLYG